MNPAIRQCESLVRRYCRRQISHTSKSLQARNFVMSRNVMSQDVTSQQKSHNDIKPFCPIHHWRMAHDTGSTKVGPSYRCSYDGCTVRYTSAGGYFELNNPAGAQNFVLSAEILCCTYNPQHYPAIVGYVKQSIGRQTEESRHWQCLAENCNFSLRQKLSPPLSAPNASTNFVPKHAHAVEHDHALWPR